MTIVIYSTVKEDRLKQQKKVLIPRGLQINKGDSVKIELITNKTQEKTTKSQENER